MPSQRYLLVPLPKCPYGRVGPLHWQDWYRQTRYTTQLAQSLRAKGADVQIALITDFQPAGQPSEIEIYTRQFKTFAPGLPITPYPETHDTIAQIEKIFALAGQQGRQPIIVSAWLHYPRALYLAHGRKAEHHCIFGIPQPAFAVIDPLCLIFQPLTDLLGLTKLIRTGVLHQRHKGRIL